MLHPMLPVIEAFMAAHQLPSVTVVATLELAAGELGSPYQLMQRASGRVAGDVAWAGRSDVIRRLGRPRCAWRSGLADHRPGRGQGIGPSVRITLSAPPPAHV